MSKSLSTVYEVYGFVLNEESIRVRRAADCAAGFQDLTTQHRFQNNNPHSIRPHRTMEKPVKSVLSVISDNGPRFSRDQVIESLFDEMAATKAPQPWTFEKPVVKKIASMDWEITSVSTIPTAPCSTSSIDSESCGRRSKGPRVHFVETGPEDRDVLRTEYESNVDYDNIRSQWFAVADFKSFRKACQEAAARASRDSVYCKHFFDVYSRCFTDQEQSQTSKLDFSDHRGLERAIFRQPLITDKIAAIRGVVRSQDQIAGDEELGDLSARYTSTARKMARFLAIHDRWVVDQPSSPKSLHRPRRFIEI